VPIHARIHIRKAGGASGIYEVESSSCLRRGDKVACDEEGRVIKCRPGDYPIGEALDDIFPEGCLGIWDERPYSNPAHERIMECELDGPQGPGLFLGPQGAIGPGPCPVGDTGPTGPPDYCLRIWDEVEETDWVRLRRSMRRRFRRWRKST
jgi:hypothetical protein